MEPCIILVPILIAEVVGHYILNPIILVQQDVRWWPKRFSIGDGVVLATYLQIAVAVFAAVAPEGEQRSWWAIGLTVVLLATAALWSFAMATAEQRQLQPRKKIWLVMALLPLTGLAMIAAVAAVAFLIVTIGELLFTGISAMHFLLALLAILALYPAPSLLRRLAGWIVKKDAPAAAQESSMK